MHRLLHVAAGYLRFALLSLLFSAAIGFAIATIGAAMIAIGCFK